MPPPPLPSRSGPSAAAQPTATPAPVTTAYGAGGAGPSGGILELHNGVRARHHAAALSWSPSLEASAQQWASRLVSECSFHHSGPGENLAYGQQSWDDVANAWYSEVGGGPAAGEAGTTPAWRGRSVVALALGAGRACPPPAPWPLTPGMA